MKIKLELAKFTGILSCSKSAMAGLTELEEPRKIVSENAHNDEIVDRDGEVKWCQLSKSIVLEPAKVYRQ
jgi:hypothetical protein